MKFNYIAFIIILLNFNILLFSDITNIINEKNEYNGKTIKIEIEEKTNQVNFIKSKTHYYDNLNNLKKELIEYNKDYYVRTGILKRELYYKKNSEMQHIEKEIIEYHTNYIDLIKDYKTAIYYYDENSKVIRAEFIYSEYYQETFGIAKAISFYDKTGRVIRINFYNKNNVLIEVKKYR